MDLILQASERRKHGKISQGTIGGLLIVLDTSYDIGGQFDEFFKKHSENFDFKIAELLDGKEQNVIFKGNLKEMLSAVYASDKGNAIKQFFQGETYSDTENGVEYILPFNFGTNYPLKNGVEIFVEVTKTDISVREGANTNVHKTTVKIEGLPSIGVTEFIPKFDVVNLDASLKEHKLSLGSSVHQVILIPNEKDVEFPIEDIEISSDKLNTEFSNRFIMQTFKASTEPTVYNGDMAVSLLKSVVPLHGLSMNINVENADGNRRLLIVRKIQTPKIVNQMVAIKEMHATENLLAIKSLKSAEGCNCTH